MSCTERSRLSFIAHLKGRITQFFSPWFCRTGCHSAWQRDLNKYEPMIFGLMFSGCSGDKCPLIGLCHPPHSTSHPLTSLTPSSALPRAWERNSGNIFHVKCRGPVEGCDASALFRLQKRNRLWWGQFLLVSKKQALSHTDFLPHWTAQSDPRPTRKVTKKYRERRAVVVVR